MTCTISLNFLTLECRFFIMTVKALGNGLNNCFCHETFAIVFFFFKFTLCRDVVLFFFLILKRSKVLESQFYANFLYMYN